jgi:tetratricopeptide (TPR) repeat protein
MLIAFLSRNIEEAEKAFVKLQESEADPIEKIKNETRYLWMRYNFANDISSLARLETLAERKEYSAYALYWMGRCYETVDQYEKASAAYEKSARLCEIEEQYTEEQHAEDIVAIARCLLKAREKITAFERIMNELKDMTDPSALAKLYEGLASLYGLNQEPEFRAIALEKALESKPDVNLQFSAAYSYSRKDENLAALALLHYKTLLRFQPDHAVALNNIGVQYRSLQMPIRSIKYYRMSAAHGETLAMANLANIFMNVGLAEEASEILHKAIQQENVHKNIGSALAALSENEDEESKIEERLLNSSREQQRFISLFAEAYFVSQPNCPPFEGEWQLQNSMEVTISRVGDYIEGNGVRDKEEYKSKCLFSNRGAKVSIDRKTKRATLGSLLSASPFSSPFSSSDISVNHASGYAYLSLDGQQLFIMSLESNLPSFETLTRLQ